MEHTLIGLASVFVIGITAQWLAWRLRIPSILLLLVAGFLAGPVTGWLQPDLLFGETLFAGVSVAVAIILFEGGLSLDIAELRSIGPALRGLLLIGPPITWATSTLLAKVFLGWDWPVAALLGGILVVTGPTVIIPLLRQVRPTRAVSSIARWEGIVTDPVGAIIAVLIFDFFLVAGIDAGWQPAVMEAVKAGVAGGGLGLLGAGFMVLVLYRFWVPDFLRSHVTLAVVLGVFAGANEIVADSGLLAVTVMGSAMASQNLVEVRRIVQFKENLRVLLISVLFVILAARLPLRDPVYTNVGSLVFLGLLIVVQRPITVFVSTLGTKLKFKEKLFLALLAPRGIVAAAVGSVFSIQLVEMGIPGGDQLGPVVFLVIIGTVTFYGLLAGPLARFLGLAVNNPQGLLFVGAARWVRGLAKTLSTRGYQILLVDSNWQNVTDARRMGLRAHYANILDEDIVDELDLDGIGRCVLATPNDEVNALAGDHLREIFDVSEIYQVAPSGKARAGELGGVPEHLRSRILSDVTHTWRELSALYDKGYVVKQTSITDEFSFEHFQHHYGGDAVPLFVHAGEVLQVLDAHSKRKAKAGSVVISLVPPDDNGPVKAGGVPSPSTV